MTNTLYIPLKNRATLAITGADARNFLQGLVTNDIQRMDAHNAIYALMLTPQGKFLYDFCIVQLGDRIILDCSRDKLPDILKKLLMYKLRSDVQIADISQEYEVISLTGRAVFDIIDNGQPGDAKPFGQGVIFTDPRNRALFARAIILRSEHYQPCLSYGFSEGAVEDYDAIRIHAGVPSGDVDMESGAVFPHDFGMDALHAISYDKGCYVGQEVTARVHHRGNVRKGIYVLTLPDNAPVHFGDEVLAGGKPAGRLLSVTRDAALAVLSQEVVEKENNFYTVNALEVTIRA